MSSVVNVFASLVSNISQSCTTEIMHTGLIKLSAQTTVRKTALAWLLGIRSKIYSKCFTIKYKVHCATRNTQEIENERAGNCKNPATQNVSD
mgnify:CR=1 FL=1